MVRLVVTAIASSQQKAAPVFIFIIHNHRQPNHHWPTSVAQQFSGDIKDVLFDLWVSRVDFEHPMADVDCIDEPLVLQVVEGQLETLRASKRVSK